MDDPKRRVERVGQQLLDGVGAVLGVLRFCNAADQAERGWVGHRADEGSFIQQSMKSVGLVLGFVSR